MLCALSSSNATVITAVVVPAAVSPVEAGWLVAVRQRGPLLASEWLQGAFSDVWDLGANVWDLAISRLRPAQYYYHMRHTETRTEKAVRPARQTEQSRDIYDDNGSIISDVRGIIKEFFSLQ